MSATLRRSFPTARKAHRCGSCGGSIAAGDRYHSWTGTGDMWDGVATFKECAGCFERYGRHFHLSPENRAIADEWMAALGRFHSQQNINNEGEN